MRNSVVCEDYVPLHLPGLHLREVRHSPPLGNSCPLGFGIQNEILWLNFLESALLTVQTIAT